MTFHELYPMLKYGINLRIELTNTIRFNDQKGGLLTKEFNSIPFNGILDETSLIRNVANSDVDSLDVSNGSLVIRCSYTYLRTVEDVDDVQIEDEDCFNILL